MHAQQPDRIDRHEDSDPVIASAGKNEPSLSTGEQSSSNGPPASFDDWLDARLRRMYRAVINEPLPPEMLELLRKPKKAGP